MKSAPFLLCLALFFLVSCNRSPLEVRISRCPAVAVVGDAGSYVAFDDDARHQEDMRYLVSIANVTSSCEQSGRVVAQIDFDILARREDGFQGNRIDVGYFAAVLKDNSQLVSKKTYEISLDFDEAGLARTRQTIEVEVPTIEQARKYNYEFLLGLNVTPDQAYFNIAR